MNISRGPSGQKITSAGTNIYCIFHITSSKHELENIKEKDMNIASCQTNLPVFHWTPLSFPFSINKIKGLKSTSIKNYYTIMDDCFVSLI
jgi:hypothetical protein